ncbi:hypothetical protein M514_25898 [Trichuris suis]|uniref:Uncharacterized protein n=1 Tax=Trichuris suis TaxID=68888 RepID=A0A085MXK9_9BILA|nr:hypothetical protein M514_25898 [Trichuris suis]
MNLIREFLMSKQVPVSVRKRHYLKKARAHKHRAAAAQTVLVSNDDEPLSVVINLTVRGKGLQY